jgi:hypothetical protein
MIAAAFKAIESQSNLESCWQVVQQSQLGHLIDAAVAAAIPQIYPTPPEVAARVIRLAKTAYQRSTLEALLRCWHVGRPRPLFREIDNLLVMFDIVDAWLYQKQSEGADPIALKAELYDLVRSKLYKPYV